MCKSVDFVHLAGQMGGSGACAGRDQCAAATEYRPAGHANNPTLRECVPKNHDHKNVTFLEQKLGLVQGENRMKGWWEILGGKKDARQGGRKRLHWMSRINNPNLPEAAPPLPLLQTDHEPRNFDFLGGVLMHNEKKNQHQLHWMSRMKFLFRNQPNRLFLIKTFVKSYWAHFPP